VGGFERPAHVPPEEWFAALEGGGEGRLRLRVRFNGRAAKSADLAFFFGRVDVAGGVAEMDMDPSDVDFYASRLLGLGTDVVVESPPEVVEAVREKATEIAEPTGNVPGATRPCHTIPRQLEGLGFLGMTLQQPLGLGFQSAWKLLS
jgi:hypothetical protein